ncbi:MAG: transcription antitermination factor NusB [Proteobacteria bacterium]|nr:transcription antitermination factor NusB [Pseudomonadota bacterium]
MSRRRRAREHALKALFYVEGADRPEDEALDLFIEHFPPEPEIIDFFHQLAEGVLSHREELDSLIRAHSKNWKMSRMSGVDRNILRFSVYELLFCTDIPPRVTINEAVEIGKKYGSDDSGAFINGILDAIRMDLEKRAPTPPGTPP